MNGFEMRQNIKIKEYLNRNKPKPHSPLPVDVLLQKNQHTLVVMTPDEFWDFFVRYYKKKGLSDNDIVLLVIEKLMAKGHSEANRIKKDWEQNRENIKTAGGFLPMIADAKALSILAYDMKRGRNLWSKFRIQNTVGTSYIILEGNHRLRNHLTGTRFLANNPKVVSMGLGKTGANKAIRGGGIVTVIFSVFFHGMDQLMNDELTWHHFVGGLAADVVIAAAASGIIWSGLSFTGVAVAGLAIGPLLAIVVVGGLLSYGLSKLFSEDLTSLFVDSLLITEKYYKNRQGLVKSLHIITTAIAARNIEDGLLKFENKVNSLHYSITYNVQKANSDPLGYMYKLFNIPDTRGLFK
ncbi:MAG: hypothetical protein CMP47_01200 [Rickettsiales bacterium]|nr:hypothetical protein [Rickettsiales bacterium]